MPKKKTNYESKGFVRQLSNRIFSGQRDDASSLSKSENKWRPRKNKFTQLNEDDAFDPEAINPNNSFSVESETGEYKKDLMAKEKNKVFQRAKKRNFSGINIKPSARDTDSRTSSARKKKHRTDSKGFPLSSEASLDISFDDMSRQTASSKQTTSHYTVASDPTSFFSQKPSALTKCNLEMLTSTTDGIENKNPRSKFYQFSIDEDKESTVVLPVGNYGDDNSFADNDDMSRASRASSKASTKYALGKKGKVSFGNSNNFFPAENTQFVPFNNSSKPGELSSHRATSTHSLCYSPSPKFGRPENSERDNFWQNQVFQSPASNTRNTRPQTQPRPVRDHRMPLSPLNGKQAPNSTSKLSSMKKEDGFSGLDSWSEFVKDESSLRNNSFLQKGEAKGLSAYNMRQDRAQWKSSPETRKQLYGHSKENKPLNSFDSTESDTSFRPRLEDEAPIGIQSFEGASKGSSGISSGSHGKILYTHGMPQGKSSSFDDEYSTSNYSTSKSSSVGSIGKPMGLPSNAIMGSMLFQRHHKVDTRAVEAKLKAKREEKSKLEFNRGDIPRSIQPQDDMYSCVSSFSDDTGIEPWKKPTRDLLDHFANSRKTGFDTRKYRREQQAQATTLFEA